MLDTARLFAGFDVLDDMMLESGVFFSFVHVRHVKQGET